MIGIFLAAAHPGPGAEEGWPLTRLQQRQDCCAVRCAASRWRLRPQRLQSNDQTDGLNTIPIPRDNPCCNARERGSVHLVIHLKDEQQLSR